MTIRELAQKINVSPAAISIVLNGRKGVSNETRKKIQDAIDQYHYKPTVRQSASASNVLLIKYWKSGLIVEENQGFISMIIDSIEEQLRKEHFGMTMMVVKKDLSNALKTVEFGKYCGVILIASELAPESYPGLNRIPVPFVVVDNTVPDFPYSSVCMNNYENTRMALEYVRKCGHEEVGYLRSSTDSENFKARHKAFWMYTKELGLKASPKQEYRITPSMLGAHDSMKAVLDENPKLPTCFFADNDTIALGAIKALQEAGYAVPKDISVIGFDDIPFSSISVPTLTTVHVQRNIIGKQAVNQLVQLIEDPRFRPVKTRITGHLEVRGSVRSLSEGNRAKKVNK